MLLAVDHHAAFEEVQHHVQQLWLPIVVDLVEIDVIVLDYLELVAGLVSGKAALLLELGVDLPGLLVVVVALLLEEVDLVGAADDEHLVFVQEHLADRMRRYFLNVVLVVRRLVRANAVALSVERINLSIGLVVERSLGKILVRAVLDVYLEERLRHHLLFVVVDEVCVDFLTASEELEVDLVVGEEAAGSKRRVVATDRQGVVLDVEQLVHVDVEDHCPETEDHEVPVAVVQVRNSHRILAVVQYYVLAADVIAA